MKADYDSWAEVYDLLSSRYRDDIPFYVDAAKAAGGRVLEVACGTGRIYIELLKAGVDACGLDLSGEMLWELSQKAEALQLKAKVRVADMRNFKLEDKFSLIIIPFRAFLHNLTTDDQLNTLRSCRQHLTEGGLLILNFFMPDPQYIADNFGKEVNRVEYKEQRLTLSHKVYYIDEPDQIVEFTHYLKRDNAVEWSGTLQIAHIHKREFELLLRLAEFSRWQVYGGFDYQPLTSSKQEMVWVIER